MTWSVADHSPDFDSHKRHSVWCVDRFFAQLTYQQQDTKCSHYQSLLTSGVPEPWMLPDRLQWGSIIPVIFVLLWSPSR